MGGEEYIAQLDSALKSNRSVIFSSKCIVKYNGRAESFLGLGDRIILIKSDNTLLIHQPTGSAPVNYMKEGTTHRMEVADGKLVLKSSNLKLKESLEISISDMHFFHTLSLEDGQSILLSGSEKDMSDMLYKNPSMIEKGFKPLSREEHTKYGFIDVFGYDSSGVLTVVECKRIIGDLGAVTQLRRYVEKIKKSKGIKECRGILAAPKISSNALKMLEDWGFKFISVEPPKRLEDYKKGQKSLGEF